MKALFGTQQTKYGVMERFKAARDTLVYDLDGTVDRLLTMFDTESKAILETLKHGANAALTYKTGGFEAKDASGKVEKYAMPTNKDIMRNMTSGFSYVLTGAAKYASISGYVTRPFCPWLRRSTSLRLHG